MTEGFIRSTLTALSLLTMAGLAHAQAAGSTIDTSRGLQIAYADGRTSTRPLASRAQMWTAHFPRVPGAETTRGGLRLYALDVRHIVQGHDVWVNVRLAYGGYTKNHVEVATVRVSADTPVRVDALRDYGVEPVTFSLVPIADGMVYAPDAISVSPNLLVRAEPLGPNESTYRLIVINRAPVPLIWFRLKGYRGDRQVLSAAPRGSRNVPLAMPGAEYAHVITMSGGGGSLTLGAAGWEPLDRLEITSVLWQDGIVEGDRAAAERQGEHDRQKARVLRAMAHALRTAGERPIAAIRQEIARIEFSEPEVQGFRDVLIADLETLERTPRTGNGEEPGAWRARRIRELEDWAGRIVVAKD